MTAPVYRFLPWARRGLAQGVLDDETIADTGGTHALPARSTLPVSIDVNGTAATTTVDLYGPGDVTGIDRRVILRSDPAPGATDFEPNYLVTIDFDPPDFPWMFTPARAVGDRLRPWCVLIVVERTPDVAISIQPGAVLPVLSIPLPDGPGRELPDLAESWAWAHAQVLEEAGSNPGNDLHVDLDVDPDRNLSRLVCPRILEPNTHYIAAVVPAFDHGVRRGLGEQPSGQDVLPAWDVNAANPIQSIKLPMYHWFEFATAVPDDIESMAKRLHGPEHSPTGLGRRRVHAAAAHPVVAASPHLPAEAANVTMFGALRPASTDATTPMPAQHAALTDRLASVVAARNTEQLPPPLYGEWPAATHELARPPAPGWFAELNSTVAHRIAAGLGAEVVRRNQEAFVQAAWQQVGQVRAANDLAGRARLAATVLQQLVARHISVLALDRVVQTAGPMLAAVRSTAAVSDPTAVTIARQLATSSVPTGATSSAFRRLASPQRQAVKRAMRAGAVQPGDGIVALTATVQGAMLVEPTTPTPDGLVALAGRASMQAAVDPDGTVSLAPLGLAGRTTLAAVSRLEPETGTLPGLSGASVRYFPATELEAIFHATTGRRVDIVSGTLTPVRQPLRRRPPIDRPIVDRRIGPVPIRPVDPVDPFDPDPVVIDPPILEPPEPVVDPVVTDAFATAVAELGTRVDLAAPAIEFVGADPTALGNAVLARLAPAAVARRVATMIAAPQPVDPFRGIMAFPILPEAAYRFLDELGGGWMLPSADGLEPDTAILLQTNPQFTSAFLVGMNHEMDSELLWRTYPTDQRGTPFQRFWDRIDGTVDIEPVHLWPAEKPLATAGGGDADGQIVLLLRGQLLRRYPNMVVYAVRGTHAAPGTEVEAAGRPVFTGRLQPDISLVGFGLTPQQLAADEWWFVLEQQLSSPRFGFDIGDAPAGAHVTVDALGAGVTTADHVASQLLQLPIRVTIHRDRLLLNGTPNP